MIALTERISTSMFQGNNLEQKDFNLGTYGIAYLIFFPECVDCVMEWTEWSECQFGSQSMHSYVAVEPVGAGEECEPSEMTTQRKQLLTMNLLFYTRNGQTIAHEYMQLSGIS